MEYKVVELKEKIVAGLSVRTSNSDPNMVKDIGEAWKDFFQNGIYESILSKSNGNTIGLYTNYENGVNGKYDVIICCEIPNDRDVPIGIETTKIECGKYAKFIIKGDKEKAVGEFWTKLWEMDLDRKYSFDFEEYISDSERNQETVVYISIN